MDKKNELIGTNLKRLREEHKPKLSIRGLAQEVGLSNGYLSKLETGKIKSPSLEALTKLADYFNVDPTYFVTDPRDLEKMGKEAEKVVFAKELTLENIKNANIIDADGKQITDDERNFMLDALKNYRASKAKFLVDDSPEEDWFWSSFFVASIISINSSYFIAISLPSKEHLFYMRFNLY